MKPIFFITGPSGSGKTCLVNPLQKQLPNLLITDFDNLDTGMKNTDKLKNVGAWMKWRIKRVAFCLDLALKSPKIVVVCGVAIPYEVIRYNNLKGISPHFGCLILSKEELTKRLESRGWEEDLVTCNIYMNIFMRCSVASEPDYCVVNNEGRTPDQTAEIFAFWINNIINNINNLR